MGKKRKECNINRSEDGREMIICDACNMALSYLRTVSSVDLLGILQSELCQIAGKPVEFCLGNAAFNTYETVQAKLSKLNEKESIRKSKGVYYTPGDVAKFIIRNSFQACFSTLTPDNIAKDDYSGLPYDAFCREKTVFDPTCGAGEFLLLSLLAKFDVMDQHCGSPTVAEIHSVLATIYGNDLNADSIAITKIRLLLCVVNRYGAEYAVGLAKVINQNFFCCDYITEMPVDDKHYDIIVGNPPYVEDSKSGLVLTERFGNIYANVLIKAAKQLSPGGSFGFIIPLSYISTPRMKKLRNTLLRLVPEQYILSYADRPDCLFDSVHQKLCIVIGKQGDGDPVIFTGNYQYWYKEERCELFSQTSVIRNPYRTDSCIPKLGNALDCSIYEKIVGSNTNYSVYAESRNGNESVYLNRREAFWMKAYREKREDPEYKVFSYNLASDADYCYCLINSSLFWWYWICTSDCWHVSKELNGFMAPHNPDQEAVTRLANDLRLRLEETKVFVGTVQTEYEYKHRLCIPQIHAIDDYINMLFTHCAKKA